MSDFKYNDILNMKYPNPEIEKDFPDKILREAQFAPFAALTGHDEAIAETARQTDSKIELDEYEAAEINAKLQYINEHIDDGQKITITYFVPDNKKSGGAYITKKGNLTKIREYERDVIMDDGTEIPIDDILSIEGNQFNNAEGV
ncbi:MAG: YolD-like family protein [Oscillospiraceae bacterium]|nr:YolD-like family protein [Oscillospiraceae bacterium]